MVSQPKSASNPDAKIVRCAHTWRKTEKAAIGAAAGNRDMADKAHYRAKQELREAVDKATQIGAQP